MVGVALDGAVVGQHQVAVPAHFVVCTLQVVVVGVGEGVLRTVHLVPV